MASEAVMQEIVAFARTVTILKSSANQNEATEQKFKQAVARLRSKVTIQDATRMFEDATARADDDDRKDAEIALSALMDTLSSNAALDMLKNGLSSSDSKIRASSLSKLIDFIDTQAKNQELLRLVILRLTDTDVPVAKIATGFVRKHLSIASDREFIVRILQDTVSGSLPSDPFCAGKDVYQLRVWDLAAHLFNETEDPWIKVEATRLLESMFGSMETWNDDVLVVLNQLEIAASLPRSAFGNHASSLIKILLRYATEQELVADDALRVLAALHFDKENSPTRTRFFEAVEKRMSPDYFSLASMEVLGLFLGANSECLQYAIDHHKATLYRWLDLIVKCANDGSDAPRNVALDALSKAIRGGSLLQQPNVSLSTLFKPESSSEFVDSSVFSPIVFSVIKDQLSSVLRSVNTAIRSLHPHIQIAGYLLIRMLVSQNAKWGIVKVFEHIPKEVLLNPEMPSPNTNMQVVEARFSAISSSALQFLNEDDDAALLRSIKKFVLSAKDASGSLRLKTPAVDVATMRA